jgi:hypothetical protein
MNLRRLSRPSLADFVFVLCMTGVPLGLAPRLLNGDGDLGRHLRVGGSIIDGWALPFQDRFSYTMAGHPLVPYEWLSEVLYALAHRAAGLPGVAVLSALLFATAAALAVLFLERRGIDPLLCYLAPLVGALLASSHLYARPHLFTLLGASILLHLVERDPGRSIWPFAPLFVLWANLHGGFLFGLVVIAIYCIGDLAEWRAAPANPEWSTRFRYHAGALALATLASCLTPSGPRLFAHVIGYLGNSYLVDHTLEYQSPDFHTWLGRAFLIVAIGTIAALAHDRRRPQYPRLFLILACLAFALNSVRNVSLFGLTAVPLLALHLDPVWRQWKAPGLTHIRAVFAADNAHRSTGLWAGGSAVLMALLAWHGGSLAGVQLLPTRFLESRFPVHAVEQARAAGLRGRLFHEFIWGGYLLFAWPEQQVFIDGQTDFYGEALTRSYAKIDGLEPGWREEMQRWDISLLIVPTQSKLTYEALRDPSWRLWYCDSTAVVLRHSPGADSTPEPPAHGSLARPDCPGLVTRP